MPGAERQAAIVRAAIELFSEKGFRGATTRELAAAVGVTEPVLYMHFATKRELYAAIIESKIQEHRLRTEERLRPHMEAKDDRGFFSALAEQVLEKYEKDPAYVRLIFFSALERHELADMAYERQLLDFYRLIARYLRRRMREGALRQMHPLTAARCFVGMVTHHGLVRVLFPKRAPRSRKRIVETVVDIYLNGILKSA